MNKKELMNMPSIVHHNIHRYIKERGTNLNKNECTTIYEICVSQIDLDRLTNEKKINSDGKYSYELTIGGKTIIVRACNLQTAIENEGYVILSMHQDGGRYLNGRYTIYCEGNYPISARWLEFKGRNK